ncbi:MAG: tetratricopeptide repeat protein [Bryobacteraceae bacterium]|nr:tetratricopeptide repeat protein [Bryobacteraceae bacterium]
MPRRLGCVLVMVWLSGEVLAESISPAERRIESLKKAIDARPDAWTVYNDLAMAYARRARETADPEWYARAEEAIAQSLKLKPENTEAEKARVWVLLGKHEFRAALTAATALNKRIPDDVMVYGFLTDANVELGNYKEAEQAAQWMLDLRPGAVAALTRGAYLREIFGDIDGAIDLMKEAYLRTPRNEAEERAWLLTQLSHLSLLARRTADAERMAGEALQTFPDYHYALAALASVREAQGKYKEAAELQRKRFDLAPHPENLHALAEALAKAGDKDEAEEAYRRFEKLALAESENVDNANRELVSYYAGVGNKPMEALRLARAELARRRDVFTRAAYAEALAANGRHGEASKELGEALAIGTKDPRLQRLMDSLRKHQQGE